MSDARIESFETPGPAKLRVEVPHGDVRVRAVETGQTRIELVARRGDSAAVQWIETAEVVRSGDEIVVRRRGGETLHRCGPIEVTIELPEGSAADLATGSGDIGVRGRMGRISATTGSGDVRIAACEGAGVRTGSGDITIEASTEAVEAKSGSGDVRIGKVGGDVRVGTGNGDAGIARAEGLASLTTASGDIEVGEVGAGVEAFTASGDVQVARAGGGRVRARSVSGDVSIGVPAGVAARLDISTLTGALRSELEAADPPGEGQPSVELVVSTVSGDVRLSRL